MSIVFVHGTGVRHRSYVAGLRHAEACAQGVGIQTPFIECLWGDPLGIEFEGLSLPGLPTSAQDKAEGEDFARWSWLFYDPLSELDKLTLRAHNAPNIGDPEADAWREDWQQIVDYVPGLDLRTLLQAGGLDALWNEAWRRTVIDSDIPPLAFERSVGELPEARSAMARAIVAQLHVLAVAAGQPGPSRQLREKLVTRLVQDWGGDALAPADFFQRIFKRIATTVLRRNRYDVSMAVSLPLGDILLYQAHGEAIREFIRAKILSAGGPVTVVAHSLGGIAAFDLLQIEPSLKVERLVTVGSQVPLLYEFGALKSLRRGQSPRPDFPRWLNVYDPDDFLSYVGAGLFGARVKDVAAASGQPFPDSHSAYFGNEQVWQAIKDF